ncbi:hypothetical protein [Caldilinea sp.]|uniref:hypothetical protein n=1 Tax=Caldilinea sp. TaxID=2293560 RepID=UPI002B94EBAF|nr:hypothetical protein [Caldilinea sp.]
MDYLLVLFIGILIGWLMTWFWFIISNRWNSSKNLRGSYDKTIKEITDKGKKARDDKQKSRNAAMRAIVEGILFVVITVLLVVLTMSMLNML